MKFFSKNGSQEKMGEARRGKKKGNREAAAFNPYGRVTTAAPYPIPSLLYFAIYLPCQFHMRAAKEKGRATAFLPSRLCR